MWRQIEFNGIRGTELRGLWAMEGDMMGGPFVLHAIADEANGRVVVAEMIVYYPGGKKKKPDVSCGVAALYPCPYRRVTCKCV